MIANPGDLVSYNAHSVLGVQLVTEVYADPLGQLLEVARSCPVHIRVTGCYHNRETMLYRTKVHER